MVYMTSRTIKISLGHAVTSTLMLRLIIQALPPVDKDHRAIQLLKILENLFKDWEEVSDFFFVISKVTYLESLTLTFLFMERAWKCVSDGSNL